MILSRKQLKEKQQKNKQIQKRMQQGTVYS